LGATSFLLKKSVFEHEDLKFSKKSQQSMICKDNPFCILLHLNSSITR